VKQIRKLLFESKIIRVSEQILQPKRRSDKVSHFASSTVIGPVENNYLRQSTHSGISRNLSAQSSLRVAQKDAELKKRLTNPVSGKNLIRINANERGMIQEKLQPRETTNLYGKSASGQSNSLRHLLKYGNENALGDSPTSKLVVLSAQPNLRSSLKVGEPTGPNSQVKQGLERTILTSKSNFLMGSNLISFS